MTAPESLPTDLAVTHAMIVAERAAREAEQAAPEAELADARAEPALIAKLGEDVTETLDVIARRWKATRTVREKFSCRSCETITQPSGNFAGCKFSGK